MYNWCQTVFYIFKTFPETIISHLGSVQNISMAKVRHYSNSYKDTDTSNIKGYAVSPSNFLFPVTVILTHNTIKHFSLLIFALLCVHNPKKYLSACQFVFYHAFIVLLIPPLKYCYWKILAHYSAPLLKCIVCKREVLALLSVYESKGILIMCFGC